MSLSSRRVAALIVLATLFACKRAEDPVKAGSVEAKEITERAYVYAYPMIAGYREIWQLALDTASEAYRGPIGHLASDHRLAGPRDRGASLPQNDVLFSRVVMDLRAEPTVLCTPDVEKERYFSVQLIDLYSFNAGYIGSRVTGSDFACFLIAGPGWKGDTPAGIKKAFTLETQLAVAVYRTQLFSPSDLPRAQKVQEGYTVQPLSAFAKTAPPAAVPLPPPPAYSDSALGTEFIRYLNYLLQFAPMAPEETGMRDRFSGIGVLPGAPFDFTHLTEEHIIALGLGIKAGSDAIAHQRGEVGTVANGWRAAEIYGDRAFYHGDYALRAAAAMDGVWGIDASEAITKTTILDSAGKSLDGGAHRYTVTFPSGELPPVRGFWSLSMYDTRTRSFSANPIDRYLIDAEMAPELRRNADGSITLYVQKDAPGGEHQANWLPAPDGPFELVLRLYWPSEEALSDTWHPPAVLAVE